MSDTSYEVGPTETLPRRFNQNFKCIRNLVLKIEFWILKFPWIKTFEKNCKIDNFEKENFQYLCLGTRFVIILFLPKLWSFLMKMKHF